MLAWLVGKMLIVWVEGIKYNSLLVFTILSVYYSLLVPYRVELTPI